MCFGSVHPWAYTGMEMLVFFLVAVWMARTWIGGGRLMREGGGTAAAMVALPMLLLFALLGSEVVPIPPALLARLSPASYDIYARALPGWPAQPSYRDINFSAEP